MRIENELLKNLPFDGGQIFNITRITFFIKSLHHNHHILQFADKFASIFAMKF